jgi:hypothetical protein
MNKIFMRIKALSKTLLLLECYQTRATTQTRLVWPFRSKTYPM